MRAAGVQIEALIDYVSLFQQGDETLDARKALLMEQREQLAARIEQMQQSLARLDDKIARYEQGLMKKSRCFAAEQTTDGSRFGSRLFVEWRLRGLCLQPQRIHQLVGRIGEEQETLAMLQNFCIRIGNFVFCHLSG